MSGEDPEEGGDPQKVHWSYMANTAVQALARVAVVFAIAYAIQWSFGAAAPFAGEETILTFGLSATLAATAAVTIPLSWATVKGQQVVIRRQRDRIKNFNDEVWHNERELSKLRRANAECTCEAHLDESDSSGDDDQPRGGSS